jgi:predicted XRE-type DNA-binding protein
VFADIGASNADEHLVKAQLVYKIDTLMKERGLKQVDAATLFGVKQPDVSKMLRGDFRQFSVERLLRFLVALGQDVEIVVRRRAMPVGTLRCMSHRRGRFDGLSAPSFRKRLPTRYGSPPDRPSGPPRHSMIPLRHNNR